MPKYRHTAASTSIHIENDNPVPTTEDRTALYGLVKRDKLAFREWLGIKGQPIVTCNIEHEMEELLDLVKPLLHWRG